MIVKKIPIQMSLSIKSKFVGLHNGEVYGDGKYMPLLNQLDPGVQRMPLGPAFSLFPGNAAFSVGFV